MKRLDARTVEFTTAGEITAHDRFNELLDEGKLVSVAAATALEEGAGFSPEFVDYLSEGTVTILHGPHLVIPTLKGATVEGLTADGRLAVIRLIRGGRSYADALAHVHGGPAIVR